MHIKASGRRHTFIVLEEHEVLEQLGVQGGQLVNGVAPAKHGIEKEMGEWDLCNQLQEPTDPSNQQRLLQAKNRLKPLSSTQVYIMLNLDDYSFTHGLAKHLADEPKELQMLVGEGWVRQWAKLSIATHSVSTKRNREIEK